MRKNGKFRLKYINNIGIFTKLMVILVISTLALGMVGYSGIHAIHQLSNSEKKIYEEQLIPNHLFAEVRSNGLALDAITLEIVVTKDMQIKAKLLQEMKAIIKENEKLYKQINKINLQPNIKEKYDLMNKIVPMLEGIISEMVNFAMTNQSEEAYRVFDEEAKPIREKYSQYLSEIQQLNKENAKMIYVADEKAANQTSVYLIIVIAISIILSITVGYWISRLFVNPIKQLNTLIGQAEQGDFTVEGSYQSKDEIGQLTSSFNNMLRAIRAILTTVSETSHQLASSSEQFIASSVENINAIEHISFTMQELSEGSRHQVESINKSNQVIQEISDSTESISNNAQIVLTNSKHTAQLSIQGNQSIEKVADQMQSINQTVISLAEAFNGLKERLYEIVHIAGGITGIADQTNLLALNAAIEAARAGEQGKGFAVVANEVRKLAEQSAQSAAQISQLINIIHADTERTMETVTTATLKVKDGLGVVQEAGTIFSTIEGSIQEVVTQIDEVAHLVKHLSTGMNEVESSITSVKEIAVGTANSSNTVSSATEEQLASMEEISSSAQVLAGHAEILQTIIKQFKI